MNHKGNGRHVIVLMEDDTERNATMKMFTALKYKVTECPTVEAFGQQPPKTLEGLTLIVVDIVTDKGLTELFAAMARRTVSAPVLIVAATPPPAIIKDPNSLVCGYVPFSLLAVPEDVAGVVSWQLRVFAERQACRKELAVQKLVAQAREIIRARHHTIILTNEAAHEWLRETASGLNLKLGDLAEIIVTHDEKYMFPHKNPNNPKSK